MSELGQGAYGKVTEENGRAVKLFDCFNFSTITELVIANSLRHPNLMYATANSRTAGGVTMTMPLGCDLDQMEWAAMHMPDRYRYLTHVLTAIAYLHSRGIIHGDIKPKNIIIVDGHALVADFSVSMLDLGQPKTILGSGRYRAPEVTGTGVWTTAVDMWAFGQTALYLIAHGNCIEGAPPGWRSLISRCLDEDPKKRITAAEALSHFQVRQENACIFSVEKTTGTLHEPNLRLSLLYEWLDDVCTYYRFTRQTLDATKQIFDQAIALKNSYIPSLHIQLVAVAALIIASSTRDAFPMTAKRASRLCVYKSTEEEILDEVWDVLVQLEFQALNHIVDAAAPQAQQTAV